MFADALTGMIMGFASDFGVEVLADTNTKVRPSLIDAVEFTMLGPSEEFRC